MAKPTPGLYKRGKYWHIDKIIFGQPIRRSTKEEELQRAEAQLAQLTEQIRARRVFGQASTRTFEEAAARYVDEHHHKASLDRDITTLKLVMPYIGGLPVERVHSGSLDAYLDARRQAGIKAGTLNRDIAIVRLVLSLAARKWRDEHTGTPWLASIPMLPTVQGPKRKPRPISWREQATLLQCLPDYLAEMVLFALHTGLRDQEICGLRWIDEVRVSGTDASVFLIEANRAKNGRERIVPLNRVAARLVESRRAAGGDYLFEREGRRLYRIGGKAWQRGRVAAGLPDVRVHDLRHTFGRRLRAAGVSLEDRQDLLGHHAGRITTEYSRVEIAHLIACVDLLCDEQQRPELTLIRSA